MSDKETVRRGVDRRRVARAGAFLLLSVFFAATAVGAFGSWTYHWRGLEVRLAAQPALRGETRLQFPPLGEVRAATHRAPLAFTAELRSLSVEEVRRLALKPPRRAELEREATAFARRSALDLSGRLVLLGAGGALFAPLLLRRQGWRVWAAAPLIGAASVAATLGLSLLTFRTEAFRTPTYAGSLRQAPWAIALAQNAVSNTEALGQRLRNVADNLGALYGRIGAAPADLSPDADLITVLHVSDIHNNPAAVPFVRELAERFEADLVIDTGDLTDFGSPVEGNLSAGLAGLGAPYLFIAGNHDSETTMADVSRRAGATILRGAVVEAAGLRVLGAPDPAALRPGASADVDTTAEEIAAEGEALSAAFDTSAPPPDLVCVHNPRAAETLIGRAPVILAGHMHRASVDERGGSVIVNAGTTGGAGARYFEKAEGVPFSAALLHFSRPAAPGDRPRLSFVDEVSLDGSLRRWSLRRHAFPATGVGAAAPPTPSSPPLPERAPAG